MPLLPDGTSSCVLVYLRMYAALNMNRAHKCVRAHTHARTQVAHVARSHIYAAYVWFAGIGFAVDQRIYHCSFCSFDSDRRRENEGQRCTTRLFLCRRYLSETKPPLAFALFRLRSLLSTLSKIATSSEDIREGFNPLTHGFQQHAARPRRINNHLHYRWRYKAVKLCEHYGCYTLRWF